MITNRLARAARPWTRQYVRRMSAAADTAVNVPPAGAGGVASVKVSALVDEVVSLNMLEVKQLTDALKDRLGIDDAALAPMAMAPAPGAAPAAATPEPEPEKTEFDLKLTAFDAGKKIAIIKEVRAITGLGLKESKALVEAAPKVIKSAVSKADAEEIQRKLKDLGGTVELE